MRITILTAGTRGDTQPYVALGAGLLQAGYQVRLAAGKNYESFVKQYGLEFYPFSADFANMMDSPQARRSSIQKIQSRCSWLSRRRPSQST